MTGKKRAQQQNHRSTFVKGPQGAQEKGSAFLRLFLCAQTKASLNRKSAVKGIAAKLLDEGSEISVLRGELGNKEHIDHIIDGSAFGQTLTKQFREGLGGCHLPVPGIAPDLMV